MHRNPSFKGLHTWEAITVRLNEVKRFNIHKYTKHIYDTIFTLKPDGGVEFFMNSTSLVDKWDSGA